MAFLGDLLIRLRTDTADFQSDMGKAAYAAEQSMRKIESAAKSAFAILGAGSFVALIKGSIDSADHLNDLSKTTTIAVEQLAGLKLAAKQSGGDLDSIAASVNKLSVNMGKDAEKFAALGISAKSPLEAFKQLSDVFVGIKDPQLRAAVAAEALGKAWAGAAPLLSEGGQKIGEIVERGAKLSGVTKEITEQADAFNDKLAELTGTGGLLTRAVAPMLPLLNSLADDMLAASQKTSGLDTSFKPLAETLKAVIVLGANVSFVFQGIGRDIGGMMAQIAALGRGDFAGFALIHDELIKDADAARAALDAYEKRILGMGLTGAAAPGAVSNPGADAAAAARARAFLGGTGGNDAIDKERQRLLALGEKGEIESLVNREAAWRGEQNAILEFQRDQQAEAQKLIELGERGEIDALINREKAWREEQNAILEFKNATAKTSDMGKELGLTFSSAFEDAILKGKKFQDVLKGIANDILRIIARKTVTTPIADAMGGLLSGFSLDKIFGSSSAVGSGGWNSGADLPMGSYATGTDYVPRTGLYQLHKGEAVTPASQNGGGTIVYSPVINIDSRTDAASIARTVDGALRQSEARLVDQINRASGPMYNAVRRV